MQNQMPVFAVDRYKIFWSCQVYHQFQLFLKGMTGYMNRRYLFINNIGPSSVKVIDDLGDGLLISGNKF